MTWLCFETADGPGLPPTIVIGDEQQRSETGEPSLQSGLGDLLSGKADALVDDLHARIRRWATAAAAVWGTRSSCATPGR